MLRTTLLASATAAAALAGSTATAQDKTIVETARDSGDFETLLSAAEAAGLAEVLSGAGPYTLFAPADGAFAALPEGTLDELLIEENRDRLTAILTYHVVPTEAMAADLADGQELETVNGEILEVSIDGDTVMVGDATVTRADIAASNGVIHVIDSVLMPPES